LCPVHGQFIKASSHPFERIIRGRPIHNGSVLYLSRVGYDCVQKKVATFTRAVAQSNRQMLRSVSTVVIESATAHLTIKGSSSSSELVPHTVFVSFPVVAFNLPAEGRAAYSSSPTPQTSLSTAPNCALDTVLPTVKNTFDLPLKFSLGNISFLRVYLSFRLRVFVFFVFFCRIFPSRHLKTAGGS